MNMMLGFGEHYVDGKSIKQITRKMGLARNLVWQVLRIGEKRKTAPPSTKWGSPDRLLKTAR